LATGNTELQNEIVDPSQAINYINDLLARTSIDAIFVDFKMRILRLTPQTTDLVNLISIDVGRPRRHIVSNLLEYDLLVKDMTEVLSSLIPKDTEVQTKNCSWHLPRIRSYRTL
jgi:two-component system CheB/CheR fusion protein